MDTSCYMHLSSQWFLFYIITEPNCIHEIEIYFLVMFYSNKETSSILHRRVSKVYSLVWLLTLSFQFDTL